MTSGEGVLVLGRGHIRHFSEYALSSTISIYSTLIVIVLWDYTAVFLCHCVIVEFYLFYYGADDMQIWVLWLKITVESLILRCPLMPACLFFKKMCVVTSPWWIDRWFYTERDDSGGLYQINIRIFAIRTW